VQLVHK
jgi:hypothetical protein